MSSVTEETVKAVWRIESARLLGGLVRFTRNVDLAEDLAQEALLAALQTWPETGTPDNPGAWLMTTAKNRAVDAARRARMMHEKHADLVQESSPYAQDSADSSVGDDVLRLILIACHPVVPKDGRVALTLRLLEIGRAHV